MKKFRSFIPQNIIKRNKIMFVRNFINDFIEALMGFFMGAAIEAVFNLEIKKAIIFIIFYIIISFFRKKLQINKQDKNSSNLKFYWGVNEIKIKKNQNIMKKGVYIICVILFSKMGLPLLFAIIHFIYQRVKTRLYHFLKSNLIFKNSNQFYL